MATLPQLRGLLLEEAILICCAPRATALLECSMLRMILRSR